VKFLFYIFIITSLNASMWDMMESEANSTWHKAEKMAVKVKDSNYTKNAMKYGKKGYEATKTYSSKAYHKSKDMFEEMFDDE